jgi:hypothetical protein
MSNYSGWVIGWCLLKEAVNNTIVFTPMDDGFDRKGTSVEVIWGCKKHRSGPWAILATRL